MRPHIFQVELTNDQFSVSHSIILLSSYWSRSCARKIMWSYFTLLFIKTEVWICSDPNNESDPSSEYSLLGLTHVMNHCLGQKFIIWVKINCLDMSLKPGNGIPRPGTADESLYILLEMQHTQMGFHAFKMADKIARKEGHRQVFVEYVNEIADNSRTASFRFYEDSPLKY